MGWRVAGSDLVITKYVNIFPPLNPGLTWVVSQHRAGPHRAALHVLGDSDGHQAPPVPPVPVEHPAAAQPQEQVEDAHDGAELDGVAEPAGPEGGISWAENDDVQEDADHVDSKAEEDRVLVLVVDDAPDKTEEKQQVVYEESLSSPVTQAGPGDQNEMRKEEEFQFDPRYVRPLQLNFLISHVDPGVGQVWNIIQLFSHNSPSQPGWRHHQHQNVTTHHTSMSIYK